MAYFTKPDFSRQIKQYSGTTAILSGQTNILEKFSVKNIEIDTLGALDGNALLYDSANNKFIPGVIGSFGSGIVQGLILTYDSGLNYNVSSGSYRIGSTLYQGYLGSSVTISSGQTGGSRFDVVYITSAQTAYVKSGITATNPSIPTLSGGELQIGIIFVPVNFTGGTGTTVIQTTADTVFEYYNAGTGIQRSPNTTNAEAPGEFSFALANNSRAYGEHSSALGYYSRASGYSQTVVGPYNTPNTDDYFQVGNGTSDVSRSNAFRVTTGGSAYVQNKLFVSSYEIETTGATNGQVLKYDGTKFKPQLETITGLTFFTGGSSFISSITSNSLLVKALTGSTGITITDSNGLITLGLQLSGTNAVTLIQSLTGGTSIVSAKTGTTYFLYPIQGSGGTSVGLTDNKVTIYSDPISLISGANVGAGGAGVFSTKSSNELQFRRLSSATPTNLSINESGELVVFSANPTLDRVTSNGNITTNNISVSQISGTSLFLSSGFTFISGYNSYSNPSQLRVLLADDLGSREASTDTYQLNYFTENVTKSINPLTTGQYSAFTTSTSSGYIVTATTITVGKESFVKITGITSGNTAIGTVFRNRFETKNYNANNGVDDTTKNLVGSAFFSQFNSSRYNTTPVVGTLLETHLLGNQQPTYHNEVRNIQLGFFDRGWAYNTNVTTLFDLYINRPLHNAEGYNGYKAGYIPSLAVTKHAGIFIESRYKQEEDDVLGRPLKLASSGASVIYTYTPWSLFAEADRAYIGNTLVLASAQTLTSSTRGAWLDIGASQATRPHINFSAGTNPTSPQSGDLWWNGTQLYFRSGSTNVNLLSGGTGGSSGTGLTTGTNLGNGVRVLFSSDTTSLSFATLSSQTPSTLRIVSSSTGVILFSATTGSGGISGTYVSGITPTGIGTIEILSSVTNNNLVYKTISAGTGININEDVNDGTLTFLSNNFEYMDLATAQVGGPFTVGQWYRIPVSSRTVGQVANPNTYGDVILLAVDTDKLSPDGYLLAINADYQSVGDYSSVSPFNNNVGVVYNNMTVYAGDVVIYNNTHYQIGENSTGIPPSPWILIDVSQLTDPIYQCVELTKDYTTRNGYIIEPQKIIYDLSTDTIKRMEDKRGNLFLNYNNYIENFRFGDDSVYNNQMYINNTFDILNYPNLVFFNNIAKYGTIPILPDLVNNSVTLSIQNCNIQDNYFTNDYQKSLYLLDSFIQDKKILSTQRSFTITSSTITLPMLINGTGWVYDQTIIATGGTFNGIITAITQENQITNYYQKFNFYNNLSQNITFRNSTSLKTEGGLDAVLKQGDDIEFYLNAGVAYQKNINNYL